MRMITVVRYRTQYPQAESVCDHGFRRRACVDTSKKEVTWCKRLGHYDAEYDTTLRSPRGFEEWWHRWSLARTATLTATSTFVTSTGSTGSGSSTTTGSTTIGMATTRLLVSQLTSFLPLLRGGGVLFCPSLFGGARELSVPATEHFADFIDRKRQRRILFVVQ